MNTEPFISSWHGRVYRHIPANSPYGPLDSSFAGRIPNNRWNTEGEPTLYFGSDFGVLVAEYGRHFREFRIVDIGENSRVRRLFAVDLMLDRVFDLRQPAAATHLGLSNAPACFLDRSISQSIASYLRNALNVHAAFVPSMALLDDPARWNLVLFVDRLGNTLDDVVSQVSELGTFRFEGPEHLPIDR